MTRPDDPNGVATAETVPQPANHDQPLVAVLSEDEVFWRDHQQYLESKGYMLRPRYRPGWVPSWTKTGKSYLSCEDSVTWLVRNDFSRV